MNIGYARVSTGDQTLNLQLDALKATDCARIFEETASGAKVDHPSYKGATAYTPSGDVLVVWRLDHLGRSLVQQLFEAGQTDIVTIRQTLGISRATLYRHLKLASSSD